MLHLSDFKAYWRILESETRTINTSFLTSQGGIIAPEKIRSTLVDRGFIQNKDFLVVVRGSSQKLIVFGTDGKKLKEFPISTAAKGFGMQSDSGKTPIGLFQIGQKKLGRKGEIFVAKRPTGQLLGNNQDSTRRDEKGVVHKAEVITGFIDLVGLEDRNRNTFSRSIYLHGTNRESSLGTPASGGCIRTPNNEIIWLAKNLPDKSYVFIQPN